ncbi:MAG: TonB-dependent receptor [Smithella sp.]
MRMVPRSVLVLISFLLVFCSVAFAQAASKEDSQEKEVVMDEVVVTATKTPERRKDIPNPVVIINKKEIQASGAKSVGELLANEPGIDWQTYGNYGGAQQEIHIRGMQSNATQVLVNGISVNSPSFGSADVGKIPLENIERIEVVKGSGSLLYGSGAMGGTVNIITKEPKRDKLNLKVSAGYGSQNTSRLAVENGMFITNDFGSYLTAGRTDTDGFRDNSWLRQNDASLKLVLDKEELMKISLYGDLIDRSYGMPGVKPPAGTQDYYIGNERFYNADSASLLNYSGDKDGHIVLDIKGNPIKWFDYAIKGYYMKLENHNYERYAFNGTGLEDWITNKVLGVDGHVNLYPFEGTKLLVGGEYKDIDWQNLSYDLNVSGFSTGTDSTTKAHIFTHGVFTEAEYRPSKYGKAFAGIRNENNSQFGSEYLPLFGIVLNPLETTALKVSHGKHFLAPTPNDLYYPFIPGMGGGNPDLKPETGWHTDVTLEQSSFENKLFFTVSYFHWNVDDKIQWLPDSQGAWSPINLANYKADGIETGLKIGPFYNLTMGLSYTYTNAEEETREYTKQDYITPDFQYSMVNRRATMTPRNQFKADLTYKSSFGLTAMATARYVGDRVIYNTETTTYPDTKTVTYTLDSYWTADLKLEQRLYKHWLLSLSVNNLFDKEYDVHLASFTDRGKSIADPTRTVMASYPGAGRSVFAGVAYEF